MIQTKSTKSNYRSSHTTPKESEEEQKKAIINFQRLPIEEVEELKTSPKGTGVAENRPNNEEKTPPEEAKKTPEEADKAPPEEAKKTPKEADKAPPEEANKTQKETDKRLPQ